MNITERLERIQADAAALLAQPEELPKGPLQKLQEWADADGQRFFEIQYGLDRSAYAQWGGTLFFGSETHPAIERPSDSWVKASASSLDALLDQMASLLDGFTTKEA